MIFIFLAVVLGLGLGFFSFYHLELFLAGSTVFTAGTAIFLRLFFPFSVVFAGEMNSTGQSRGFVLDYLDLLVAIFHFLPQGAQTGLILLPFAVILGRVLTWAHYELFPNQALPLTEAERREATMQRYSFKGR